MREVDKDNKFYKIEDIIQHKITDGHKYTFLVKWKGYENKDNSWVKEDDFNEKDIIKDYFCKKHIIYYI
ncbi:hypothetical protein BDA99DRAFT_449277 [Phascolomyces articulosus]|uniref:Chromo domain-containing protein n=1 Tax=Phascolomyces articulosus TaxID=60185 RepID=A0AAD5P6L2_9FUNG|nr:hypothetical protein BDA99DRAFT_449277 [Phascolomyces articulosus]